MPRPFDWAKQMLGAVGIFFGAIIATLIAPSEYGVYTPTGDLIFYGALLTALFAVCFFFWALFHAFTVRGLSWVWAGFALLFFPVGWLLALATLILLDSRPRRSPGQQTRTAWGAGTRNR